MFEATLILGCAFLIALVVRLWNSIKEYQAQSERDLKTIKWLAELAQTWHDRALSVGWKRRGPIEDFIEKEIEL